MKKRLLISFEFISIFFVFILVFIGIVYAWFIEGNTQLNIEASSKTSYFHSGTGTEEDPYTLTTPKHVYNLAWLQNLGLFTEKTHFKLLNSIDMAGFLYGDDENHESGAIPPIGTTSNPFVGSFDGDGHAISNVWVSSNPGEWKESPPDPESIDIGTDIGFFGSIAKTESNGETNIGTVTNFVLENIEVSSHITESYVGIVAGYSNGVTNTIGVKNAKINVNSSGGDFSSQSQFTLIGHCGPDIEINNLPGSVLGNKLLIDPANSTNPISTAGSYVAIPDSTPNTAYYVGAMGKQSYSPQLAKSKKIKQRVTGWLGQGITTHTPANSSAVEPLTSSNCPAEMWARFNSGSVSAITPNTIPNVSTLRYIDEIGLSVPDNGMWFKPQNAGSCFVAIGETQNNDSIIISIYSYKRNGTQIQTPIDEIQIQVTKRSKVLGNNTIFVFEIDIPEQAIAEDREFVIGTASGTSNPTTQFLYLILPGAGKTPEEGNLASPQVFKVDYTFKDSNNNYDIFETNYTQKNVAFSFNTTTSASLYYNTGTDPNNKNIIYYYDGSTTGGPITDDAAGDKDGVEESNTSRFPSRVTTAPIP